MMRPIPSERTDLKVLGVIPARFASTRLPGKPLALIGGIPMVEWVARGAETSHRISEVVIATDDERVRDALDSYGRTVMITSPELASGTDRVAMVAARRECDVVVNIQGDEPQIKGEMLDHLVEAMAADETLPMATLSHPMSAQEAADPNAVKVVSDMRGRALYFSRSPLPYQRRPEREGAQTYRKHIGIYAYRRDFLLKFAALPPSPLELAEGLEQLRALEYGFAIRVVETTYRSVGVDTPEDLARVKVALE